nr:hypothetical protein Datr000009 [Darna trima granulovirus]
MNLKLRANDCRVKLPTRNSFYCCLEAYSCENFLVPPGNRRIIDLRFNIELEDDGACDDIYFLSMSGCKIMERVTTEKSSIKLILVNEHLDRWLSIKKYDKVARIVIPPETTVTAILHNN